VLVTARNEATSEPARRGFEPYQARAASEASEHG
jgi:hypothetical protein